MRKKWGMILGLTGMMLLGAQSIYAAEAADGTAETTDAANEKETAGAVKSMKAVNSVSEIVFFRSVLLFCLFIVIYSLKV